MRFAESAGIKPENYGSLIHPSLQLACGERFTVAIDIYKSGAIRCGSSGDCEERRNANAGLALIYQFIDAITVFRDGAIIGNRRGAGPGLVAAQAPRRLEHLVFRGGFVLQLRGAFLIERKHALASKRRRDLTGFRTLQFSFRGKRETRFHTVVRLILEPFRHPGVGRQAPGQSISMAVIRLNHFQFAGLTHPLIRPAHFSKGGSSAADGKEIADSRKDQERFWSKSINEIRKVESKIQPRTQVLLRILWSEKREQGFP